MKDLSLKNILDALHSAQYELYLQFCKDNKHAPVSKKQFIIIQSYIYAKMDEE